MSQDVDLHLTLYVVNEEKHEAMIHELESLIDEHYPNQAVTLDIVDVLSVPEKALENNVFATPMLIRNIPNPIVKVLINIASAKDVFLAIRADNDQTRALL